MSDLAYKRADRVAQMLQQEIGLLLVNGVKDPRVGFVTVTEVRLSDDLRNAKVYVSIYGDDAQRETSLQGLRDAAGYFKRQLGKHIRLRYTPNLTFWHDDSLDRASRIETLMTAIADGASEAPEEPGIDAALVQTSRSEIAASREALEIARQAQEPRERKGKRRKTRRHR